MSDFSAYDLTGGDTPFAADDPRTWPAGWNAFTDALETELDGKSDSGHTHVLSVEVAVPVTYTVPGELSTGQGTVVFAAPFDGEIAGAICAVSSAPTGAAIIVDVNIAGTTVYTTQGNRPQIAATATAGTALAVPDTGAAREFVVGELVRIDIDQVGSTLPGDDLVVTLLLVEASS